jgi:hypothetical protein
VLAKKCAFAFSPLRPLVAQVLASDGWMIMDEELEEGWGKPRQSRLRYMASESVFEAGTSRMRNGDGNRYTTTFGHRRLLFNIFTIVSSSLSEFAGCVSQTNFCNTGVGIALSVYLRARRPGFDSFQGQDFLFTASRPALGPTQPSIQWVPGAFSSGVKRPGREADHSPPSSWSYTSTPPYVFMA